MKIILAELVNANGALNKIFNFPMEFKLSYRLIKIVKKINSELEKYEVLRKGIINKYGIKNEKGDVNVLPEKMEEFSKEFGPFISKEIDLDITLIPFDLLSNSGIKISSNDLVILEKFVSRPIEEKIKE